jgi:hypothetical protein
MTTNFFSPLSFVAVFGSEIRDPGWVKIRIRDKHSGSATLLKTMYGIYFFNILCLFKNFSLPQWLDTNLNFDMDSRQKC